MLRTLALAALLIVTALPVTAGFKDGVAADKRGDFRTAFREFKSLAEQLGCVALISSWVSPLASP